MKKLKLAFTFNIRHKYPDLNDPRTQLETDFDDQETIDWMMKHLNNCGCEVLPIEADEKAYLKFYKNKERIDLVFNYGCQEWASRIPTMLEILRIPYTASSPLTQVLGMNKAKAKEILKANGIPTLPFQIFKTDKEELDKRFKFPLLVKPISQGSSAGITNKSVVFNKGELERQVDFVIKLFNQPALVEPFLDGREFSIPMLGTPPKILPIIESDHAKLPKEYLPIDSLEVKWFFEEESNGANFICPAKINKSLKERLEKIAFSVWKTMGYQDLCRIDVRCDREENPYVLEINSPVGLIPPEVSLTSYFPLSARAAGIDYEELLKKIIFSARKRYVI